MNQPSAVVTKVERQTRNKHRYNIYVNDQYHCSVHEDIVVKYRIIEGMLIELAAFQEIARDEEFNHAFQQALRWLSFRSHSVKEIERKLQEKGCGEEAIAEAIRKLISLQYVDDAGYAQRLTEERLRLQKKGRKWIAYELKEKGIDDHLIKQTLETVDEETEFTAALELARKRWRSDEDEHRMKRRIGAYLLRRGFSNSLVQRVLRLLKEERE